MIRSLMKCHQAFFLFKGHNGYPRAAPFNMFILKGLNLRMTLQLFPVKFS